MFEHLEKHKLYKFSQNLYLKNEEMPAICF